MKNSQDINSFTQLYQEYNDRFIHFAKTYVNDLPVAEDIVMDSMMYYWENRLLLKNDSNIPSYILNTIKNKCLNYLKREQTLEEIRKTLLKQEDWELNLKIATLEACNPEKLFSDEIQHIIDEVLGGLSPQSREIFIRSKYENQTNKEIASDLGLSVKSIEYHITKTLKLLRKALRDYIPFLALLHI